MKEKPQDQTGGWSYKTPRRPKYLKRIWDGCQDKQIENRELFKPIITTQKEVR